MFTVQILGQKLRAYRKEQKINQQQMADAGNVSRTALSDWESGKRTPNVLSVIAISQHYGISIEDLFELPLAGSKKKA